MVRARSCKSYKTYTPSKKAVERHKMIHTPGGILTSCHLHPNEVDSEDVEETVSNVRVQDPTDDRMPTIIDINEYLDCP